MVNLPGPPRVGNIHGQHEAVLTSTPAELIQGYPDLHTQYPEADWCRQMAPDIREDLLHDYLLTWCKGPLQPYARVTLPCGIKRGYAN